MCAIRYVDPAVVTIARGGRDSNNPSSCTCLKIIGISNAPAVHTTLSIRRLGLPRGF